MEWTQLVPIMTVGSLGASKIVMTLNPSFVDLISLKCIEISARSLGEVNEVCVVSMIVFWFHMICICTQYHIGNSGRNGLLLSKRNKFC